MRGASGDARGRVKPQKTALILAQRIVSDIHRRGLKPGDKLPPERRMMEEYEAGRGTLRESLRFLELQGLLSFKPGPGGGPVVEKPGPEVLAASLALLLQFDGATYRVIAEARVAFEPLMATLAAERITEDGLKELERSVSDMEAGLADTEVYLESNERFHGTIAWASGNSLFGFLIDVMVGWMDLSGVHHGVEYPLRHRQAVLKKHQRILEAIKARDGERAREAMHEHIQEYLNYINKKYPNALSKPITWG